MTAGGRPSPIKAANEVSILLRTVLGEDRFPVNVEAVAKDYSTKFPDPITKVVGESLGEFEGMLRPGRKKPAWHIIYNNATDYRGRERFTLAHEFGHYLLHRRPLSAREIAAGLDADEAETRSFACSPMEQNTWKSADSGRIEEEADTFASYLLMPMDDYRLQVEGLDIDRDLLRHVTGRYGVSLTAAVRKLIEFTDRRAAMVVARDGFALWGRASREALKTGIFIRSGMEIPDLSIAAQGPTAQQGESVRPIELPEGVWSFKRGSETVRELTIFSPRLAKSLSILLFEDRPYHHDLEEEPYRDTFDQLQSFG
ncbi:MAG: ImmA/IrrE family metallo-endopeptidase [Rhodospirillaceae bacterium]